MIIIPEYITATCKYVPQVGASAMVLYCKSPILTPPNIAFLHQLEIQMYQLLTKQLVRSCRLLLN